MRLQLLDLDNPAVITEPGQEFEAPFQIRYCTLLLLSLELSWLWHWRPNETLGTKPKF